MKVTFICSICGVEIGQLEVDASDLKPVGVARILSMNSTDGRLVSYACCENCISGIPAGDSSGAPEEGKGV